MRWMAVLSKNSPKSYTINIQVSGKALSPPLKKIKVNMKIMLIHSDFVPFKSDG